MADPTLDPLAPAAPKLADPAGSTIFNSTAPAASDPASQAANNATNAAGTKVAVDSWLKSDPSQVDPNGQGQWGQLTPLTPGVVNSATTPSAPAIDAPNKPPTVDYQPVMGEVTHTVQGELGNILKTGNPLLEGAKARAMQAASARGLQNSSMATQAGEEAIVNSALPIATSDAAAYQRQDLANQDITNQFLSSKLVSQQNLNQAYEAFKQNNVMFDKNETLQKFITDANNTSQEKVAAMHEAAAQASANASLEASRYSTDAATANAAAGRTWQSTENAAGRTFTAGQTEAQNDFTSKQTDKSLSANTFNSYSTQSTQIDESQLEPDAKASAHANLDAIYKGSPYMPNIWSTAAVSVLPNATTPTVTTGQNENTNPGNSASG